MKILLIIHEKLDPNSGAAGSTLKLGQHYQKLGHEVQYYSMDNLPSKLHRLAKRFLFPEFVAAHLYSLLSKQQIDVIDASTGDAWLWAKILRNMKSKLPILVTRSHGLQHLEHLGRLEDARQGNLQLSWQYPLYRGSFQLWEIATSLRCADSVFLLNRQEAKYTIEQLGVKSERVHIFPNGIPETFINLPFESLSSREDSVIRIAQVGTYLHRKGIQYSVPALNSILTRYPQVTVSLLGTGRRPQAEIYADFDPSVRDRVQVIPRYAHKTLPTLLKGHQIKLFPSIAEGFGKVLIEAMACGLTPVTTATPGPMDIVQDGHDGIIIPARDSQAIEQALERLITNPSYLEQLRFNAYSTAQGYSWHHIAQKRLSVYERILHQKQNSRLIANV